MLAEESPCSYKPTKHPRCKKLIIGNTECDIFDLKGHRRARRQWKDHFSRVRGIVFVVDATDRERLPEARAEIDALLGVKRLKKVLILVLGNKVDLSGHVSEEGLRQVLGLFESPYLKLEPGAIKVFMCSAAMKRGYGRGINWLLKQIQGIPC